MSSALASLLERLPFDPTADQRRALDAVVRFTETSLDRPVLILRGAAGTGKTALMRALVPWLEARDWFVVLMAPTGRAAKVLAGQATRQAFTVHKYIYAAESTPEGGLKFRRRKNEDPERTLYIVDEASMIGEGGEGWRGSGEVAGTRLLEDLLSFTLPIGSDGTGGRRLLLIGDPAQLPPVGHLTSPALEAEHLRTTYGVTAGAVHLREVRRQALESPILRLATSLREALDQGALMPTVSADWLGPELRVVSSADEALDTFTSAFVRERPESAALITYSNGVAVQANQAVRNQLLGESRALEPGDQILVAKNHYNAHLDALPFVANGELGRVLRVFEIGDEPKYGLRWMGADLEFTDPAGEPATVGGMIPIDLLTAKDAALTREQIARLWKERREELANEPPPEGKAKKRRGPPEADPYLHPIQLKHGYALTGHKAQGGQWDDVVVMFEPSLGRMQAEDPRGFLRWCYTAITRARTRLTLFRPPFTFS